ncbi:hypothetical protein V8F06_012904 [Rhypophila decipiens]
MAPTDPNPANISSSADIPATSAVCIAIALTIGIVACLCQRRVNRLTVLRETGPSRPSQASSGLDTKALDAIPIITYRENSPPQEMEPTKASPGQHDRGRFPWSPCRHVSHKNTPQDGGNMHPMSGLKSSSCAICTEDLVDGSQVRSLPCGHCFHPACVESWLLGFSTTCPLCRVDLRTAVQAPHESLVRWPCKVVIKYHRSEG